MNGYFATTAFFVDGVIVKDAPDAHYRMISPDYFRVLGIPLREGRASPAPIATTRRPWRSSTRRSRGRYFAGRGPVGRRMRLDDGEKAPREVEIVGVVGDVRHFGLEKEVTIEVYVPIGQVPDPTTIWLANNMYWVVHTEGAPLAAPAPYGARSPPSIRPSPRHSCAAWINGWPARWRRGASTCSWWRHLPPRRCCSRWSASMRSRRRRWRTPEGDRHPRRAGGVAPRGDRLVLRTGLAPVLAGLAQGPAVAVLAGDALGGMLFGVRPAIRSRLPPARRRSPQRRLLANLVPALRAASIDPIAALRVD